MKLLQEGIYYMLKLGIGEVLTSDVWEGVLRARYQEACRRSFKHTMPHPPSHTPTHIHQYLYGNTRSPFSQMEIYYFFFHYFFLFNFKSSFMNIRPSIKPRVENQSDGSSIFHGFPVIYCLCFELWIQLNGLNIEALQPSSNGIFRSDH
jgi:hypothetical protein